VSHDLDLNDSGTYRDLSKPIGTLNQERIEAIRLQRSGFDPEDPMNSFYRQNYSNPFYVLLYLVRLEPFTTIHIELCDKKFDKTGRMFFSIGQSWESVTGKFADFRELIPEFFCLPEFLINESHFDLGKNIDDVVLPPWAKSSPHLFISLHRQALESDHVSLNLHNWINLIFGFQQSGKAVVEAENTFNPACYAKSLTPEVLAHPEQMSEIWSTALFMGIVPRQVFTSKHPRRSRLPGASDF
jgi:hypothetical protein